MFLSNFPKLFLYINKQNRLLRFQVTLPSNITTTLLPLTRSLATVGSYSEPNSNFSPDNIQKNEGKRYFMQYLLTYPNKYSVVNTSVINLEDETKFKSLTLLKDFLENSNEEELTNELQDCLTEELGSCGLEDIYKLIILISKYSRDPKMSKALVHINYELGRRRFSPEEVLKMSYVIQDVQPRLFSKLWFTKKKLCKLCWKMYRLSSQQVVLLFLSMKQFSPEFIKELKYSVQENLSLRIPEFNAEELGIISAGLLRSKFPFSHTGLTNDILSRTIEEMENMNDFSFCNICALLETSLKWTQGKNLLDFQEKIIPYISKLKPMSLSSLATLGSGVKCMNPLLWEILADIFKKNIDNYSLSDINRMVYATTVYNIQDEELLSLAIKHFEVRDNILNDPDSLINLLYNLIHHNLYPENLLHLLFSNKFTSNYNPERFRTNLKQKYCFVHCCVELERPTHNYELLDSERKEKKLFSVFKRSHYMNESSKKRAHTMYKIRNILEKLFGENSVCKAIWLRHLEPGLVMRFDKNFKAQAFESRSQDYFSSKEALKDNHFWLYIMVVPSTEFLYESEAPVLALQTQIRQLKALGYKPLMINYKTYIHQDKENRELYLRNIIMDYLQMLRKMENE